MTSSLQLCSSTPVLYQTVCPHHGSWLGSGRCTSIGKVCFLLNLPYHLGCPSLPTSTWLPGHHEIFLSPGCFLGLIRLPFVAALSDRSKVREQGWEGRWRSPSVLPHLCQRMKKNRIRKHPSFPFSLVPQIGH